MLKQSPALADLLETMPFDLDYLEVGEGEDHFLRMTPLRALKVVQEPVERGKAKMGLEQRIDLAEDPRSAATANLIASLMRTNPSFSR